MLCWFYLPTGRRTPFAVFVVVQILLIRYIVMYIFFCLVFLLLIYPFLYK